MPELLIIKPSSLGDIVHALQVATTIKVQRPDVRISWIAREIFAPIVERCEAVDRVHVFGRKDGAAGFIKLMREVRKTKFDVVMDMQGLIRSGLMTFGARGDRKVGRSDSREGSGFFYDETVALPAGGAQSHAVDILLQFCPVLGLRPELRGVLKFRGIEPVDLSALNNSGGRKLVVMFPDSRREEKKWGGFSELAELMVRDGGWNVVWAGNVPMTCDRVLPADRFLNLTAKTSLGGLVDLIGRADWVVSNDSGPMHIAAAMGIKTLGVFGPTDPKLYGPYPAERWTNQVICAPSGDLKQLPADEVLGRLQRMHAVLESPIKGAFPGSAGATGVV